MFSLALSRLRPCPKIILLPESFGKNNCFILKNCLFPQGNKCRFERNEQEVLSFSEKAHFLNERAKQLFEARDGLAEYHVEVLDVSFVDHQVGA